MKLSSHSNVATGSLLILIILCGGCDGDRHEQHTQFVAFSLREAVVHARGNGDDSELRNLGGITRIAGMVYDKKGKDIILVGLAAPELPDVQFDDLVVALCARLRYDEFPLVSIDPVEDTEKTGLQRVRFDGHIESTPFGSDLLQCDILLKLYSLQQVETLEVVRPFNVLLEDDLKAKAELAGERITHIEWHVAEEGDKVLKPRYGRVVAAAESYQARFWFREEEPYYASCKPDERYPEVFCIRKLKLCIRSESIGGENQLSPFQARERFAEAWTEHFDDMCEKCPKLRKLKALYDLVAVADVIRMINVNVERQPYLDYLLRDYRVSPVPTDSHYRLQHLYGVVQYSNGQEHVIRISGGIELRPEIKLLNYGNVTQLRSIVTRSRPSDRSLVWKLPLDGWKMPNAMDIGLLKENALSKPAGNGTVSGEKPGCSILCESVMLTRDILLDDDDERRYAAGPPPPPPPPPPPAAVGDGLVKRFRGFGPPPPPPPALRGVSMRMVVDEDSFTEDESGALNAQYEDTIQNRPDSDSLSWKLKKKETGK